MNTFPVESLVRFLKPKKNLVCITGAGISTASGIPDYRGKNGSYKKGHKPMIHSDFITKESSRKRYWTRSMAGYKYLSQAKPNLAHDSLRALEEMGILRFIITQNVDGLHQKAGSNSVLDLHGRIEEVKCLSCSTLSSRSDFQIHLEKSNEMILKSIQKQQSDHEEQIRADGDMDVDDLDLAKVLTDYLSLPLLLLFSFRSPLAPPVVKGSSNQMWSSLEIMFRQM
jgi:NAD-dependent SIR2 family protein deacetylase